MSKIRKELEKAIGTKQEKDEDYQEYIERLADESDGLSDDDFDGLSEEAQGWLNTAVSALDKNKEVKDFPDNKAEEEEKKEKPSKKEKKEKKAPKSKPAKKEKEKEVEEEAEEEVEEEPKKEKPSKKEKKAPAKKAEKKADKPEKEKKEKAPKKKRVSAISRIQFYTCKHPKMTKEQIGEKVAKEGLEFKDNTLSIQYGQAQSIMKILTELGWSK